MSWNPFKGSVKRNLITPTEERDFDREHLNIQHLEEASKKINKEGKKIVTAINEQSKACSKIGCDLVNDFSDDASENMKEYELAMNKQFMLAADKANMIQHSLVGPMKEYCTIFPLCFVHIKNREKALQEYSRVKSKLERLEEKDHTAPISVKIGTTKRELQPVKEDFEQKHATLMKELPELYRSRLSYILPSLEAFLNTQCWFHNETLKSLERCAKEVKIDGDVDSNVAKILDDIKLLSITSDD